MPITSIPSKQVFPTQPKVYNFSQGASVSGTWYTAINATGIRGILSKATMTIDGATGRNDLMEIRITIDGIANTIGINNASMGLNHGGNTSGNTYQALDSLDYFSNAIFTNSILVEFRQITGVGRQILANVQYSTE
jgi:hypothetical protein